MTRSRPARGRRRAVSRLLALGALLLLLGGGAAVVLGTLAFSSSSTATTTQTVSARPPASPPKAAKPRAARSVAVKLSGVAAFDPEGDGQENDDLAPDATDGDLSTSWRSETYRDFAKSGVGLVLDAGRAVRLSRLVLRTDTPGYTAEIRVGSSPRGPFTSVSRPRRVTATTVFPIAQAPPARYVVVWIVAIPAGSAAHVNEVSAARRQAG